VRARLIAAMPSSRSSVQVLGRCVAGDMRGVAVRPAASSGRSL
jgi:hypothetical protein